MKRIVVTGALGHIGSRLIRELPAAFPRAEIILLDNLSTQRYGSLFRLPPRGRYRFIEADVLKADLARLFSGADVVVHLAALTDAVKSLELEREIERTNVEATARVARACIETRASLIFISTTSVYGTQASTVDEDCSQDDLKPQSPYAASKLRAERRLSSLGESRGLNFVICRFGTIFGVSPGMRFHTAVNKLVWQACLGEPLTLWRTAVDQRRPYLDLGDAVRALVFIIKRRLYDRKAYNVLTTNATIGSVVEEIRAQLPKIKPVLVDAPIMNRLSYDVSNAKFKALGFKFTGSLSEGIADTIGLLEC